MQLVRFIKKKKDFIAFLQQKNLQDDGEMVKPAVEEYLLRRGKCTCRFGDMLCGPLDPFEYDVTCRLCNNVLPPFADQMIFMTKVVGESVQNNLNQAILEREEERKLLEDQQSSIDIYNDVCVGRRGSADFTSSSRRNR